MILLSIQQSSLVQLQEKLVKHQRMTECANPQLFSFLLKITQDELTSGDMKARSGSSTMGESVPS